MHVNPLAFVPQTPGLCRPAARSDGRDGHALPRSGKHAAVQRLVEQPDHDGVHGQRLRLRVRHLRQLAHHAAPHLTKRQKPVFRSPASLVANMQAICRLTHGPILLVGDLLHGGSRARRRGLERLRVADLPNEIVFEFFALPPASFLAGHRPLACATGAWSSVPKATSKRFATRRRASPAIPTRTWKRSSKEALRLRCSRIDVFFMIGLPAQTTASVRETVEYCGHLFQLGDKRLSCFISPDGSLHRSRQPRLRGARAFRLPPVRAHAGRASAAAGTADLGAHPELRDEVDDAPGAGRCDLRCRPSG